MTGTEGSSQPAPGLPVAPPPDATAGAPATKGAAAGTAPGKTRTRKALSTILVWVCVAPVVIAYERLTAPTCSSGRVEDLVQDIVETKLLHLRKFSVALSHVSVLERNVFGDRRCSADVVVDGKPTSHRVEYRWTTDRNHLDTVYAKLKP